MSDQFDKIPERAILGDFSPKFQAIWDKRIRFLENLPGDAGVVVAQKLNERAVYLQGRYENYDKWEAWHVIAGSSLPEKHEPDFFIKDDFPGGDSVEKFLDDLIAKYPI